MQITSWRVVKKKHTSSAFSGIGSRLAGGRWNNIGTCVVYTAESLALATLETLVHQPSYKLLETYRCVPITFDEDMVTAPKLPKGWDITPPGFLSKDFGDKWIHDNDFPVLKVPSKVIPNEHNFLINPNHSKFSDMVIGDPIVFPYDSRLVKK